MYNLGDHFKNSNKEKLLSKGECVFKGSNYRISVLSERLVRLEYSPDGKFNDLETTLVKNRLFDIVNFVQKEDDRQLIIETSYFTLYYTKNMPFSSRSLRATIPNRKIGWNYGNREVRNFKSCSVSLDGARELPDLYSGLFSEDGIATIDDSKSITFDENSNIINEEKNRVDLYLFIYGKDFGLCLKDYFTLTGFPYLIPRYALGNWWSRDYDYNFNELFDLMIKFQKNNVPLSVLLLDSGWSIKDNKYPKVTDSFSFNENLFPNPSEFIEKIHNMDVKIGLKINPQYGFYPFEKNYSIVKKYKEADKNGVISFNPYNMQDIDIYLKLFLQPLENIGVDLFWNNYYGDKNGLYLLNYYLLKDNMRLKKRSLMLSRNSTYSGHLFNVLYSGREPISWDTLRLIPFYNLNSANIGICFWSHDVGGSTGGIEDSDLYIRSIQLGVFSPILRFNTEKGKYFKREPWKWDVVTDSIASSYLRLRHKLIPYIYSESYNYSKGISLLIRPFYYNNIAFYDDENYVNQYYFGNSFMISPIIKPIDEVIGRTIQKFYLPEGVWYDFRTGKRFLGNRKYISFYAIDDYPIFVKQGSIIPMAGENSYKSYKNPIDFEIHVFPGESNTYRLYEDDGETLEYQKGNYSITEIDYNYRASNYTIIIRHVEGNCNVIPEKRDYKIVFRNTKQADKLVVYDNENIYSNVTSDVTDTDFIVNIKGISTNHQIVVNCYGQDIEIDSLRLIKDDIDGIISDLKINTVLKDDIALIMFNENMSLGNKRIAIRKLKRRGLDTRSVKIFLRLLDYMEM